jgi:hypothetical protein
LTNALGEFIEAPALAGVESPNSKAGHTARSEAA